MSFPYRLARHVIIDKMETSYPQRPERRHRRQRDDYNMLKFRNVLNIIFMLMAIIGVVLYFTDYRTIGTYVLLASMAVKMVECCIRLLR